MRINFEIVIVQTQVRESKWNATVMELWPVLRMHKSKCEGAHFIFKLFPWQSVDVYSSVFFCFANRNSSGLATGRIHYIRYNFVLHLRFEMNALGAQTHIHIHSHVELNMDNDMITHNDTETNSKHSWRISIHVCLYLLDAIKCFARIDKYVQTRIEQQQRQLHERKKLKWRSFNVNRIKQKAVYGNK